LDDVGTETGEQLGGERERLHLLQGKDAHPVERLAILRSLPVAHLADLHPTTVQQSPLEI
jgi:hypothetical protein